MNQAISAYAAWLPAEGAREIFRDGPADHGRRAQSPRRGDQSGGRLADHRAGSLRQWMPPSPMAGHARGGNGGRPTQGDPATGQPKPFAVFFPAQRSHHPGHLAYGRHARHGIDRLRRAGSVCAGPADGAGRSAQPSGARLRGAPVPHVAVDRDFGRSDRVRRCCGRGGRSRRSELCKTKTAAYNATPLREQQLAQFQMGKAKARVEASRDTLYRAASAAYDETAVSKARLSSEAKIRLQLAVSFAAEACAEAVRFVNDAVGASSIRLGSPFERHFRDAHVLLQHSSKSSARYGSAGRLMFGLENDWVWLSF